MKETVFAELANSSTPLTSLEAYRQVEGYRGLEKALAMTAEAVTEEIKKSNLRGRGGAGFSTGVKWGFMPKDSRPKYLVCNGDEGEPGTFKDRYIITRLPHQLIEGMIIAAHAMKIQTGFIYLRGEFVQEYRILEKAIKEARQAGYLGTNFDLHLYRGAGAY
ncbi:MAG: NADH-quinone oxidoreductase subunit F, partial [Pseudomonadota bacterium]